MCRREGEAGSYRQGAAKMKFGLLNFFEHPAGNKSEQQIVKEQLDCLRAAEDMGSTLFGRLNTILPNTAFALLPW
jgi:hypothetical protein